MLFCLSGHLAAQPPDEPRQASLQPVRADKFDQNLVGHRMASHGMAFSWPGLTKIANGAATAWSTTTAMAEVETDVHAFVKAYDETEPYLLSQIASYASDAMVHLRPIMEHGLAAGQLSELPSLSTSLRGKLVARVRRMADAVSAVRADRQARPVPDVATVWVEGQPMRAWPLYIKNLPNSTHTLKQQSNCSDERKALAWDERELEAKCEENCAYNNYHPIVDSYHNGHIFQVLALAALLTAEGGDSAAAARYISDVGEALYDRFFTPNRGMSLLDLDHRIVYVPKDAPALRLRRHELSSCEFVCLDVPQAHNHGIQTAMAAIYLRRAILHINWKRVAWPLESTMEKDLFLQQLDLLVQATWAHLHSDIGQIESTEGPLVQWRYRKGVEKCDQADPDKYRTQDISHAKYEIAFITALYKDNVEGADSSLLKALMRTYLQRLVHDLDFMDGRRFACDLAGTSDVLPNGDERTDMNAAEMKSCRGSRREGERVQWALQWMQIGASIFGCTDGCSPIDAPTRCNALKMARSIFPFILQDSNSFGNGLNGGLDGFHRPEAALTAILTKYYFYHYANATCIACGQPQLCEPAYEQSKDTPKLK